jgi:hypothetical protein
MNWVYIRSNGRQNWRSTGPFDNLDVAIQLRNRALFRGDTARIRLSNGSILEAEEVMTLENND